MDSKECGLDRHVREQQQVPNQVVQLGVVRDVERPNQGWSNGRRSALASAATHRLLTLDTGPHTAIAIHGAPG